MSIICKDSHKPTLPHPQAGCQAEWIIWSIRYRVEKTNEPEGVTKYQVNWQSFCKTSGSAGGATSEDCWSFVKLQDFWDNVKFSTGLFPWVGGVMGSGGRKKWPRALMAQWAKAGDNFFKIFFGSFFPSTGKKWSSPISGQPAADGFEVAQIKKCQDHKKDSHEINEVQQYVKKIAGLEGYESFVYLALKRSPATETWLRKSLLFLHLNVSKNARIELLIGFSPVLLF